jgi:hypothetical protein
MVSNSYFLFENISLSSSPLSLSLVKKRKKEKKDLKNINKKENKKLEIFHFI